VGLTYRNADLGNNTALQIQALGEEFVLTCHTDIVACCRVGDTGTVGMGEWYYPSGEVVPNRAANMPFYRTRNAPQLIRLARRQSANPSGPTGSYCCVIPSSTGEVTYCVSIGNSLIHCKHELWSTKQLWTLTQYALTYTCIYNLMPHAELTSQPLLYTCTCMCFFLFNLVLVFVVQMPGN